MVSPDENALRLQPLAGQVGCNRHGHLGALQIDTARCHVARRKAVLGAVAADAG